ncbi:hypothetical protein LCG56_28905 (plasmid) [Pseudomonas cannabina pv. alisalensis]|uniref:Uncharacterized protein n=1 Tax=Pseudomonas syringae pv. maculicola str. ES4326 TaxID=629265 RepID=A0A8T8CB20_PSEYM|nr:MULTISPECIES: hypothetical protein [Pseudomonas syringae group]QHF00414.1 hypothetical protein PMA4326_028250 [Pseudomonas syringae pv. maculicola str. ES4326]UBZ00390.1 hypothetical protein LCG56_28905 [Pseudomonas cannabina pv. alisalensis]
MSEIQNIAKALAAADWSGVSIGNKALIQAAIEGLKSLQDQSAKLESRRMLLDRIRTHLIEKNALADFGPELFLIINNRN